MIYPEHIYDPKRIELASMLLEKEFAKLFPDLEASHFEQAILGWREDPKTYHLEDGIRDFWDIFAATLESIKLKPTFTSIITAANHSLSRVDLDPRAIIMSSHLDQLKRLDLSWSDSYRVDDALNAMSADEKLVQRSLNDEHSSEAQDAYPIIVNRLGGDRFRVMDGNRRSLRAALYDKATIDAWVIETTDEQARDYWVPVGDLMLIAKLYRFASSDAQRQTARDSLEMLFQASTVARINYETRILKQSNPWAEKLYALEPSTSDR